jgi:hypothetical protein
MRVANLGWETVGEASGVGGPTLLEQTATQFGINFFWPVCVLEFKDLSVDDGLFSFVS